MQDSDRYPKMTILSRLEPELYFSIRIVEISTEKSSFHMRKVNIKYCIYIFKI